MEKQFNITPPEIRKKRVHISLKLLLERQFGEKAKEWDEEKKVNELSKSTHIRLDRESIGYIDGLELLGQNVTNLYLQHNKIERIENLEFLPNVRFITLANNLIGELQGLRHLKKLGFLDLSENHIAEIETDELPKSLVILNFEGNKCTTCENYRGNLIQSLPRLKTLDGTDLVRQEKIDAGYQLSSDSEEEEDGSDENISAGEESKRTVADMLISSQKRLEGDYSTHKLRLKELDEIRENSAIPIVSHRADSKASYEN